MQTQRPCFKSDHVFQHSTNAVEWALYGWCYHAISHIYLNHAAPIWVIALTILLGFCSIMIGQCITITLQQKSPTNMAGQALIIRLLILLMVSAFIIRLPHNALATACLSFLFACQGLKTYLQSGKENHHHRWYALATGSFMIGLIGQQIFLTAHPHWSLTMMRWIFLTVGILSLRDAWRITLPTAFKQTWHIIRQWHSYRLVIGTLILNTALCIHLFVGRLLWIPIEQLHSHAAMLSLLLSTLIMLGWWQIIERSGLRQGLLALWGTIGSSMGILLVFELSAASSWLILLSAQIFYIIFLATFMRPCLHMLSQYVDIPVRETGTLTIVILGVLSALLCLKPRAPMWLHNHTMNQHWFASCCLAGICLLATCMILLRRYQTARQS